MTVSQLRRKAEQRIRTLSPERLRVAVDLLTYLEDRRENAATKELLRIPGLRRALRKAEKDIAARRTRDWRKVRRDV